MKSTPLRPGTVVRECAPDGVPASQVRGILRTFQKALVSEGLVDAQDTVTISREARALAAEIAEVQERPEGETPAPPLHEEVKRKEEA